MKSRHLLHGFCAALLATAGVFGTGCASKSSDSASAATADLKGGQAGADAEHGKSGEPHGDATGDDQSDGTDEDQNADESTNGDAAVDDDQNADEAAQGKDDADDQADEVDESASDSDDQADEVDEAAGDDSDDGTDEAGKPDGGAGGIGHAKNKAGHGDDDQP
jgi:hypothetical protein